MVEAAGGGQGEIIYSSLSGKKVLQHCTGKSLVLLSTVILIQN